MALSKAQEMWLCYLTGKRDCPGMIELRILTQRDHPGLLGRAQWHHIGGKRRRQENQSHRKRSKDTSRVRDNAQECRQCVEAEKGKKWILPESSKENTELPTQFALLNPRTARYQICIVLRPQHCSNLLQLQKEMNTSLRLGTTQP